MAKEYIPREALTMLAYKSGDYGHPAVVDLEDIADIPAADVVEVKHGRWVDNGIPESMLSKCSVCDYSCGAYSFNYCPNCGAKMDGKSCVPRTEDGGAESE